MLWLWTRLGYDRRKSHECVRCHASLICDHQAYRLAPRGRATPLKTNQRALPVLANDEQLVGIICEGDFLHREELGVSRPADNWLKSILGIEENGSPRKRMGALRVEEVMTGDPLCVDEEASLDDVINQMDIRRISQLPVVCGSTVVGMISRVELLKAIERQLSQSEALAPAKS